MTIRSLLPVCLALAWLLPISPVLAADAPQKPIRVLLIDGQNNHAWKSTTPVLKQALDAAGVFAVTISTTPAKGASADEWGKWKPDFSQADVVLSNYNGELWPVGVQDAFVQYVKDGGGFVCVHAANNSFPEWLEYNRMIGLGGWGGRNQKSGPYLFVKDGQVVRDPSAGPGGSHGAQHEFTVVSLNAQHPITAGMPPKWLHTKDELYDSLRGPAESVEVLAYAYSDKSKKNEPMILTVAYGKGRVFHTPMGHADYSMQCVGFQSVLQRGTEWAATGKVSIPWPAAFPTEAATLSITK